MDKIKQLLNKNNIPITYDNIQASLFDDSIIIHYVFAGKYVISKSDKGYVVSIGENNCHICMKDNDVIDVLKGWIKNDK